MRIEDNGALRRLAKRLEAAARSPEPLTRRVGQVILRATRRRAPVASGLLRRSLHVLHPDARTIVLASPLVYAGIQEHGGRIAAGKGRLKARALAIPVGPAGRALIQRLPAGRSLRTVRGLFLLKTKRGKVYLARARKRKRQGKVRRKIELLFVLRKAVEIRGQHYVVRLGDRAIRGDLRRAVAWFAKAEARP